MVTTVGGVAIEIRGDPSGFQRTMREVQAGASKTGQNVVREFDRADRSVAKLNGTLKSTASSMLALGAAVGVGAGLAGGVKLIANFSQAMSTLQAITQGTTAEIIALEAVAKDLGATTRFSATQAADAMSELARAGFTVNQVLAAIGPTLSAAQAGGAGIAETAAIIGASIGGFGLQATDAARIADVLAQAANGSAAGILDLGEALKFAAPTAKQLGLGLEETVAIIGKLSDGGITGGLAGRGFQSLATQLVNEKDKIEDLIGTYDLASEGLGSVLARLRTAGITTAQIIEIFRAENLDTFGILSDAALNGNLEKLNTLLDQAAGSSAKAAKVMDDNLNGAILNASSAFEGLILAIADAGVEDGLRDAFVGLSQLLTLAADNVDVLGVAVVAVAANALIPLAVRAVPAAITALRTLAVSLTTATTASARLAAVGGLLGGPLTVAIIAASAAYLVLARNAETAKERLERTNEVLARADEVLNKTRGLLTGNDSPLKQVADQATDATSKVASLTDAVEALQTGLSNLREEGQIATALEIGQSINEVRAEIEALQSARADAVARAVGNTPNLGGREGLQRIADRAGQNFDDSEQGRQLLFATQKLAALEQRLLLAGQGLTINDVINQFRNGSPDAPTTTTATGGGPIELTKAELRDAQAELDALLDSAEELFTNIQDRRNAESQQRIDTFRLNQEQRDAAADAATRQRYDEFQLNKAQRDAAERAIKDAVSNAVAQGIEQGIISGDWGQAFEDILAQSTAAALSDAIAELADGLVDLLGGVLSGIGQSAGLSLGGLFGGGRAAGGPVKAGMRYMVGEQGPEMFVPTVPGVIIPKTTLPASAALGGMGSGGVYVDNKFIVQGSITEEVLPRVQAMMAAQARELPRIIDSRVKDSSRRGRY